MVTPAVVVLELNELAPHLLRRWIGLGLLPGFARLLEQSTVYTTQAREGAGLLEPWIQWVTVHSGLDYDTHQVFKPYSGHRLQAPRLWDMVSSAGGTSLICGSVNTGTLGGSLNGALIPELAGSQRAQPAGEYEEFLSFIRSTFIGTEDGPPRAPRAGELLRFVNFMSRNGLSKKAVRMALRQLVSASGQNLRRRRTMLVNRLLWDLFRSRWHAMHPHLATICLQAPDRLDPQFAGGPESEGIKIPPTADEKVELSQAVLDGYKELDAVVSEALQMVDESGASLVLITALSQHAPGIASAPAGKQIFWAHDPMMIMALAGIELPAVQEAGRGDESRLVFESLFSARKASAAMATLRLQGNPLLQLRLEGHSVYLSCTLAQPPAHDAMITTESGQAVASFHEMFYPARRVRGTADQREGLMWIRPVGGGKYVEGGTVPLRQTAPTLALLAGLSRSDIAHYFELPPLGWPGNRRADRRARSWERALT